MSSPDAAEQARLKKLLAETEDEMTVFREKIKLKLAGQISERRRLVERAEMLTAENAKLGEQLASRGAGGADGDDDDDEGEGGSRVAARRAAAAAARTPEETAERAAVLGTISDVSREIELIQYKVRSKVQQLVIEKHAATARLRELEASDTGRVQELRAQYSRLQEDKTALLAELSEHKTTLQNAKMWRTQNEHLVVQIKRATEQQAEARALLERTKAATEAALEEKTQLRNAKKSAAALAEKRKRKLESERESSSNAGQWSQQNEFLAEQIKKLRAANAVLEAQVADKQGSGEALEAKALGDALEANARVLADHRASVARLADETTALESERVVEGAALELLVPEVTGLRMRIQTLDRAVQVTHSKNAALRQQMLDVEQASSAASLKANELISRVEQIAELEAENDELRFGVQELRDQGDALTQRKERLMFASFKKSKDDPVVFDVERGVDEILQDDSALDSSLVLPAGGPGAGAAAGGSGAGMGSAASGTEKPASPRTPSGELGRSAELRRLKSRSYSEAKLGEIKRLLVGADVKDNVERISLNAAAQVQAADASAADDPSVAAAATAALLDSSAEGYFTDRADVQFLPMDESKSGSYPAVKAGTLERLVERLTFEAFPDMEYLQTFMLTYRSFTTPQTLMELLIARYCVTPPDGLDEAAAAEYKSRKIVPIRFRVFNVMRGWVANYPRDFESGDVLAMLRDFADNTMSATGMKRQAQQLNASIKKLLQEQQVKQPILWELERVLPKSPITDWLTINLREFARNMCVIEMQLYASVPVTECLSNRWAGSNKAETAPCIFRTIEHFNRMTLWVTSEVVRNDRLKPKARAKIVSQFIKLALELKELNNLNGVMEVVGGLANSAVKRLKKMWKAVDSKLLAALDELKQLTASYKSYALLRQQLHISQPPCVPYLGVYLTDLTFIEDGNPSTIMVGPLKLINFVKRQMAGNVIRELLQYQRDVYEFPTNAAICDFIIAGKLVESDDACFDLSLRAEPRET